MTTVFRVAELNSTITKQSAVITTASLSKPTAEHVLITGPDGTPVIQTLDHVAEPTAVVHPELPKEHQIADTIRKVGSVSYVSENCMAIYAEAAVLRSSIGGTADDVQNWLSEAAGLAQELFLVPDKSSFTSKHAELRAKFVQLKTGMESHFSASAQRCLKAFEEETGADEADIENAFDKLQLKKKIAVFFRANKVIGVTLLPFNFYGLEKYDVSVVTGGMLSMFNYGFGETTEDDIQPRGQVFLLPTTKEDKERMLLPSGHMLSSDAETPIVVRMLVTVNEDKIDAVCKGLPVEWAKTLKKKSFLGTSNSSKPIGRGNIIDVHVGPSVGAIAGVGGY